MLGKFPPEFRKWKTRGIDWAGVAANQPSVSKHKLLHPPEFSKPCARARAHSALRDRVNFPTSRRGIECNRITRSRRLISRNSKIIRSGGNRRGYLGGTTFRLEEDENRARSTDFYDLTPNPIYLYLGTWNLFLHREES